MNWTKNSIRKSIIENELGIKMANDILSTVEQFKKYVSVDKRFINKLNELGYFAYIQKDDYSTRIHCSTKNYDLDIKAEFNIYKSQFMRKDKISWEDIKLEVVRHAYEQRLQQSKDRLEVIDKEIKEFAEYLSSIRSKKFLCFETGNRLWDMETALSNAQNDV